MKKLFVATIVVLLFELLFASPYDIRLFNINGEYYNSKKVRKAVNIKYIVVDFFSATCSPCKKSLPKLNTLYKKYKDGGIVAVVVAEPAGFDNEKEELSALKVFSKKHHILCPILFDTWQKVAERYKVGKNGCYSVPQYFILDREGKIIFRTKVWKELKKRVKHL